MPVVVPTHTRQTRPSLATVTPLPHDHRPETVGHRGLGAHLLRDAITRSVAAADLIGVRAMLVHALHDQARAFYTHFGFEPSPTDPLHLLLLIKDARAALDQ
jgi:N-acetylglutamate synthase-like GNAT family acetyltransferase